MADNSDFDVEKLRWAATTALVRAANVSDPAGAVKDVGWATNGAHNSAYENNSRADTYVIARWLVEDILPQLHPWNGLLPGQQDILVAPGALSLQLSILERRYWLGSQLVTVPANAALAYTSNPGPASPRNDYVAVEVTNGVGTYIHVPGDNTTGNLPTLAANQHALATFEVGIGPAGNTPQNTTIVMFQPAVRPESRVNPTETIVMGISAAAWRELLTVSQTYLDISNGRGTISFRRVGGVGGWALFPVDVPVGATITAIRARGVKDLTAPATSGFVMALRRRLLATDQPYTDLATVDNEAAAQSVTPFVLSLAPSHVIEAGYVYDIEFTAATGNTDNTTNPELWSVEIDFVRP